MREEYERIINMPVPHSRSRRRMSVSDRSAQFAPFSALTGYEDAISERARLTDSRRELGEEELALLNSALLDASVHLPSEVMLTYFIEDGKKHGGSYVERKLVIKEINEADGYLLTSERERIYFSDVSSCILLS